MSAMKCELRGLGLKVYGWNRLDWCLWLEFCVITDDVVFVVEVYRFIVGV